MQCVNVLSQISSIFFYLSHSAIPGIPDNNGISCSRDRIGRYGRSVSADIPHQTFRLDNLTRKNNKLNIYSVTSTVVPYCKLRGILPRNSTEHKGQMKREKKCALCNSVWNKTPLCNWIIFVLYRVIVCLMVQAHWSPVFILPLPKYV